MTPVFRHPIGVDLKLTFSCTPDVGMPVPNYSAWSASLVFYHQPTGWVAVVNGTVATDDEGGASIAFNVPGAHQYDWVADEVRAEMQIIEDLGGGNTKTLRTEPVSIILTAPVPPPAPLTVLHTGG